MLTVLLVLVSLVAILFVVQLYDRTSTTGLSISPTANPTIVKNTTDLMANFTPSVTATGENSSVEGMKVNNSTLRSNATEQPAQAMPQDGQGGTPPEGFNGAPPSGGAPPEGMPSGGTPPEGMSGAPGGAPPEGASPVPGSTAAGITATPTTSPGNGRSTSQSGLNGGTTTTSTMADFSSWMPTVKPINMSKFLNMSLS